MFDTQGYYEYLREQRETVDEIPDWAPRSAMYTSAADENFLTRIEKKLGRVMNYGEARWAIHEAKAEAPSKRFIDRVFKCPVCGRWHDKARECIPF